MFYRRQRNASSKSFTPLRARKSVAYACLFRARSAAHFHVISTIEEAALREWPILDFSARGNLKRGNSIPACVDTPREAMLASYLCSRLYVHSPDLLSFVCERTLRPAYVLNQTVQAIALLFKRVAPSAFTPQDTPQQRGEEEQQMKVPSEDACKPIAHVLLKRSRLTSHWYDGCISSIAQRSSGTRCYRRSRA